MGVTVAQSQVVDAQAQLGPVESAATMVAGAHAGLTAVLPRVASDASAAAHDAAAVVSRLSPLVSLVVTGFAQTAVAVSRLNPLQSVVHVQPLNVTTVAVMATLPALRSAATSTAIGLVQGASRLPLSALLDETAAQAVQTTARLPALWTFVSLGGQAAADIKATLGPLATAITAHPPPMGYAADGHYYAAIAARAFYASIDARSFYNAITARPFYILSDQNMTPIFSTLDPRETEVLTFDASNDLDDGETLTGIEKVEVTVRAGAPTSTLPTLTDPPLINGAPVVLTVNGKTITIATGCCVQVVASGGVTDCQYLIAITCNTSNPDKVLVLKGVLPVSAN